MDRWNQSKRKEDNDIWFIIIKTVIKELTPYKKQSGDIKFSVEGDVGTRQWEWHIYWKGCKSKEQLRCIVQERCDSNA
jgi:hypothetical protein